MSGEKPGVSVSIAVDDDYVDRAGEVAERLRAAGVDVHEVLGSAGVIRGRVDPAGIEALGRIEGVGAVERERTVRIPPPDSNIQ